MIFKLSVTELKINAYENIFIFICIGQVTYSFLILTVIILVNCFFSTKLIY